ncbi:hypothetical protein Tco_0168516 [Tanacetum coccineum]
MPPLSLHRKLTIVFLKEWTIKIPYLRVPLSLKAIGQNHKSRIQAADQGMMRTSDPLYKVMKSQIAEIRTDLGLGLMEDEVSSHRVQSLVLQQMTSDHKPFSTRCSEYKTTAMNSQFQAGSKSCPYKKHTATSRQSWNSITTIK